MDNHLNLFYGYSQGGYDNFDEIHVLEDNVTRALIITLKEASLTKSFLKEFINFNASDETKEIKYDLQSFDDDNNIIYSIPQKYLLGISPSGNKPTGDHYFTLFWNNLKSNKFKISGIKKINNEKSFFEYLRKIQNNKNYNSFLSKLPGYNKNKCEDSEKLLDYLIDMSTECKPDAWIYQQDVFAVIIESKIRGELYKEQLHRHLTKEGGFFLDNIDDKLIRVASWNEIYDFFKRNIPGDSKHKLFVDNFLEYLQLSEIIHPDLSIPITILNKNQMIKRKEHLDDISFKLANDIIKKHKINFSINKHNIKKDEYYIGVDLYERSLLKHTNKKYPKKDTENKIRNDFFSIIHISISLNLNHEGKTVLSVYGIFENASKFKQFRQIVIDNYTEIKNISKNLYDSTNGNLLYKISEKWIPKYRKGLYISNDIVIDSNFFDDTKNKLIAKIDEIYKLKDTVLELKHKKKNNELNRLFEKSLTKLADGRRIASYKESFKYFLKYKNSTVNPTFSFNLQYDVNNIKNNLEETITKALNDILPLYKFLRDKMILSESKKNK